jgi:hypothetical protein
MPPPTVSLPVLGINRFIYGMSHLPPSDVAISQWTIWINSPHVSALSLLLMGGMLLVAVIGCCIYLILPVLAHQQL